MPRKVLTPQLKKKPPSSSKKLSLNIAKLKTLTSEELERVYNLVLSNDIATLRKIEKQDSVTALEAMVISVVLKIVQTGNMATFDSFLDRLVDRRPDSSPIGVAPASNVRITVTLPSNGREVRKDPELK